MMAVNRLSGGLVVVVLLFAGVEVNVKEEEEYVKFLLFSGVVGSEKCKLI